MNAEDAFKPTQDRSHFFASSVANAALDQLQLGLEHALPLIVVTGEPGVGKTSVVREACARWGARVRAEWLVPTGPAPDALLPTIVRLFGGIARTEDGRTGWTAALSRALGVVAEQDETPLLIVDDAHLLAPEMLAELARIEGAAAASKRVLRIVLVGHTKLESRLEDPKLVSVGQRVSVFARVAAMPVADVRTYLHHRLAAAGVDGERVFSRKAARELHAASGGVPSRLDVLAIDSIRCARAADTAIVVPEHVQAAVDAQRRPAGKVKPPTPARRASDARTPVAKAAPAAAAPAAVVPPAAEPEAAPARTRGARATKPAQPRTESPDAPPVDSSNPRVKEWVSRFTDGESGNRFSARMELPPLTEPETFPMLEPETPEEVPPGYTQRAVPTPAPEPVAEPEHVAEPELAAAEPVAPAPVLEPIERSAPEPAHDKPRITRRERRQRERDALRALPKPPAKASAPARRAPPAASPTPSPTFSLPVADVKATAPKLPRKLSIDESATQDATAPLLASEPPPERFAVGPRAPHQGRFLHVVVPGLLMLGVAAVAIVASTRGGFDHTGSHDAAQTSSSTPAAPPEPQPAAPLTPAVPTAPAPDTELETVAPEVSLTPADTVPARFCLAVGTYLFSDRARLKARQLEKLTHLNAWVETISSDGTRSYRILIGGFATEAQAEKTADRMLTESLVTEAMVQPMPADHQ